MAAPEIRADPQTLTAIADLVEQAGTGLDAVDLEVKVDAGVSSAMIASEIESLAAAVAALAQHLGAVATGVTSSRVDLTSLDASIGLLLDRDRREVER